MPGIASRHLRACGGAFLGVGLLLALAIAGQELAKMADVRGTYWNFFGYPMLVSVGLLLALFRLGARPDVVTPLAAAGIAGYFVPAMPLAWLERHPYGLVLIAAGLLAALVSLSTRRGVALWELVMSLFWGAIGYLAAVLIWLAFFYDWP